MGPVFAVSERKGFILVSILFVNLLLISNSVIIDNRVSLFRHVIGWIISPVQILFQKSSDSFTYQIEKYIFQKNIFDEYQALLRSYHQLKIDHQHVLNRILDNDFWKNKPRLQHSFFSPVETISIDPHFPYDELRINSGSSNGVQQGMIVLNFDGDLVGQIVDPVEPFSATVRLITSQRGGVGAYIAENRLEGFLSGDQENPGQCHFKYILESLPVKSGDLVVTSGTDQIFSAYLPIGSVTTIKRDYLVQIITVNPFFTGKPIKKLFVVSRE